MRLGQDYETIWRVSLLLVKMFRGLSSTISHTDLPNRLKLSVGEWQEVFQYTEIKEVDEQEDLIKVLRKIKTEELGELFSVTVNSSLL